MSCWGCGVLSAFGRLADRRRRYGVLRERVERFKAAQVAMREMYRLPPGETEKLGLEVLTRSLDARAEFLRDAYIRAGEL